MWTEQALLDPALVRGFYDRMRAVASMADEAMQRDRRLPSGLLFPDTACGQLIESLDDDERRALAMLAHHRCMRFGEDYTLIPKRLIEEFSRHPGVGWTTEEVRWLFSESRITTDAALRYWFSLPLAAAQTFDEPGLAVLRPTVEAILRWLDGAVMTGSVRERQVVGSQLNALLEGKPVPADPLPLWLLCDGDSYGPAARQQYGELLAAPGVLAVLTHAVSLTKVEPAKRWSAVGEKLLADTPAAPDVLRALFAFFVEQEEPEDGPLLHDENETLLRGLVWLLALRDEEWVTPLLASVTRQAAIAYACAPGYPRCPRLANAAVTVRSRRTGDIPVTALAQLSLTVRNKALAGRIRSALTELGALRGWSLPEVMELAVADHGLDTEGRRFSKIGAYEAIISIADGRVVLGFARDGRPIKGVPAAIRSDHADELAELRGQVKEIGRTLTAERARLESLLWADRCWSATDWLDRYLNHPVTGSLGRRLLWQVEVAPGEWVSGRVGRVPTGWRLYGLDGALLPLNVADGGAESAGVAEPRIRLWHPVRVDVAEVRAWRDEVMATGLRQPFKQAFREVYLCTPAEEATRVYSNRYAGHILRYRQANALMRTRGWSAGYLGTWDGGYQSEAVKDFGGWRAIFFHELVQNSERNDWDAHYCATDQVRFDRRDGAVWERAAVTEVPPLVFSEAMRDVDLFVGVTSIAADPQWRDRGEDRFQAYWSATVFGELTASAEVRRDALARLLPRTKIADRVEVGERFLRVRGTRRTYRIHLGSGNILMEPNDAYLCVVADRRRSTNLHLPFDEDQMLSMIVSKAFLLAEDHKITDETILRQLDAG